ncbi:MAG: Tex family protein [Bacillota bacterium]
MKQLAEIIARELSLPIRGVTGAIQLLDAGNTIPFIARYRKEATGGLDEAALRDVKDRLQYLESLEKRKEDVLRLIDEQGKLTGEIAERVRAATTLQEVEDIYVPFKPKRRTRASIAREKGLEPLAAALREIRDMAGASEVAAAFVSPDAGVETVQQALEGAMDILAEEFSESAEVRAALRRLMEERGVLKARAVRDERSRYEMYYDFSEPVSRIPPHRVLAINRGEKEEYLRVRIELDEDAALSASRGVLGITQGTPADAALADSLARLLLPSIERQVRSALTDKAEDRAIRVFGENTKRLLMQAPVRGYRVLGIDPGYRTGCKWAAVDESGTLLEVGTIYPTPPAEKKKESAQVLSAVCERHRIRLIALGNGTASRETEAFLVDFLQDYQGELAYTIVTEAGASVYSASELAAEEFPDLDVSLRSAVSIARRLIDPLSEYVKIDPRSIGVGQYQHDVNPKRLKEKLADVVETCVNQVGVDLNTASWALLSYVAGIRPAVARAIVKRREERGPFRKRSELMEVAGLGPRAFQQSAGFLRIPDSPVWLDRTAIHPESYDAAHKLLESLGLEAETAGTQDLAVALEPVMRDLPGWAKRIGVGIPTLEDMIRDLIRPGRDPRDDMPGPVFRTDVLDIAGLREGMVLPGVVRNVVDFGAFVDVGVKQDGLVHISELSDRYVSHPTDVVSVGQHVMVRVLSVDIDRQRISLSMKALRA